MIHIEKYTNFGKLFTYKVEFLGMEIVRVTDITTDYPKEPIILSQSKFVDLVLSGKWIKLGEMQQ